MVKEETLQEKRVYFMRSLTVRESANTSRTLIYNEISQDNMDTALDNLTMGKLTFYNVSGRLALSAGLGVCV